MKLVFNFIQGIFMALADSVPGVSGGSIAFILGFYDEFITSLDGLIFGKKKEKITAIKFLVKIGIGWVIGMGLAVSVLTSLFENQIYKVSSLFLGFILFCIPIIILEEKEVLKGKYKNIIFTILGIALVATITYFNPISSGGIVLDTTHISLGFGIYVFVSGMIAISAMVLPGISGSTLLLIFGLYVPVITAVKEVFHFNFSSLPIVIVFGFGVLAGIALTIRLIKKALDNYRSQSIYTILGLMIGSLYAIVMGPTILKVAKPAMDIHSFSIIYFVIGGIVILGLQKLKIVIQNHKEK